MRDELVMLACAVSRRADMALAFVRSSGSPALALERAEALASAAIALRDELRAEVARGVGAAPRQIAAEGRAESAPEATRPVLERAATPATARPLARRAPHSQPLPAARGAR